MVGDEAEKVALGGLGLGCERGAGDFSARRVTGFGSAGSWVLGFEGSGKEKACSHGRTCMYGEDRIGEKEVKASQRVAGNLRWALKGSKIRSGAIRPTKG